MKFEVVNQRKNPLMNRDEYMISLDHGGKATPSRHDILKEVAKDIKVKEDLVIIDKIITRTGASASDIVVSVYRKRDDIPKGKLEKMERRMKKKKPEGGEAAPAAEPVKESVQEPKGEEKPAEEGSTEEKTEEVKPPEEKPAEEPQEEKVEEKPEEAPKEEPAEETKEESKEKKD